MLSPEVFVESLRARGLDFFAGVPDSLLKNVCAYISRNIDSSHNIIAANEGAAVAMAAGHYLATGRPGCVYMQNSGEGNAINPLASLTDPDVYNIPVLLVIGWRGRPGVHDEPQHVKQGKITMSLLDVMGIPYAVLTDDEADFQGQLDEACRVLSSGHCYALIVRKDTFSQTPDQVGGDVSGVIAGSDRQSLSREEAICAVAEAIGERDVVVSTTGMISRELFEYRERKGQGHGRDFLTVGSMGHACQIALGISMAQPERRVWCFDGDGAAIMHMGSMAIVASKARNNYVHVVFNNGAHDSVGGQPTVGLDIDLPAIAKAVGYKSIYSVSTLEELKSVIAGPSSSVIAGPDRQSPKGPIFIEIKVRKGNRPDLGRPTTTPIQNKEAFMSFLKK